MGLLAVAEAMKSKKPESTKAKGGVKSSRIIPLQPYIYAGGSRWAKKSYSEEYPITGEILNKSSNENIFEAGVGFTAFSIIDVRYAYRKYSWEGEKNLIIANLRLLGAPMDFRNALNSMQISLRLRSAARIKTITRLSRQPDLFSPPSKVQGLTKIWRYSPRQLALR